MPIGETLIIVKYLDRMHERGQVIGRYRGDTMDKAYNAKVDRVWRRLKLDRGLPVWFSWQPYDPVGPRCWSHERKAKSRRSRFINRIKRKFPLFATEYIRRRYVDYLVCPTCGEDLQEKLDFCHFCGDTVTKQWKQYGDLAHWTRLVKEGVVLR